MAEIIKIKRGLNIPLQGAADTSAAITVFPMQVGITPSDFPGFTWKLIVHPGDKVGKGSPLLQAKEREGLYLTSPIAGEVREVRRGERRRILSVVIDCRTDGSDDVCFNAGETTETITEALCKSGLWAMMRQRPYDVVPMPGVAPRDIFITAFDSAPLAPTLVEEQEMESLRIGVEMLAKLTNGKVYLNVPFGSGISVPGAVVTEFEGPHPAGNVGTQINAIKPINKGDVVWTLDARTAVRIGKLKEKGKLHAEVSVAITGPRLKNPAVATTVIGTDMSSLLGNIDVEAPDTARFISGNVLTGKKVNPSDDFLHFPWRQITVIAEGDQRDEFMGWASVSPRKFSVKRSFPSFLIGKNGNYNFDARILGGRRAPIMSEEYDNVFPMDIYPEFLLRAIMDNDIDRMEKLGIYEVAAEDFALPEFVDTSKIPLQEIVQKGLENLRREME